MGKLKFFYCLIKITGSDTEMTPSAMRNLPHILSKTVQVFNGAPKIQANRCCLQRTFLDKNIRQNSLSNHRRLTTSPSEIRPIQSSFRPSRSICEQQPERSSAQSSIFSSVSIHRHFSSSPSLLADKQKSSLKKPVTPKGKFDLEDEMKKKELDQIREELRLKEEEEKKKDEEEEESTSMGELVNEVTGERGGPKGQEPTEYGDWQRKGRVTDF